MLDKNKIDCCALAKGKSSFKIFILHSDKNEKRMTQKATTTRQSNVSSRTAKTLNYKTFRLFIERTMKSEDGDAVTSPSISRLAVLSQYCEVLPCL